jgi:hypothetical protein
MVLRLVIYGWPAISFTGDSPCLHAKELPSVVTFSDFDSRRQTGYGKRSDSLRGWMHQGNCSGTQNLYEQRFGEVIPQ